MKKKLLLNLKIYQETRAELKAVEARLEAKKVEIGLLREEAGVTTLTIEGFKVTQITGLRKTLNPQKLIAMGVSTEMLEEATETKPNRPYEKISVPGEKTSE